MNLDNPKNVIGMADLLADDGEDIDIAEIEQSIIKGVSIPKKEKSVDLAKEYGQEIEDLGRKFGVGGRSGMPQLPQPPQPPQPPHMSQSLSGPSKAGGSSIDDLLNWNPTNRFTAASQASKQMEKPFNPGRSSMSSTQVYRPPAGLTDADSDAGDSDAGDSSPAEQVVSDNTYYPSSNARPDISKWSSDKPVDEQLNRMTNEERKQEHVHKVLTSMDQTNDDAEFIQQEDEEDEMAKIMEQVDLLRGTLESEGVDLSRIPEINGDSSKKEAKAVLRILQIKNDRLRYCDFFEEGILAVAYGLESVFDGKREVFGSRVDLTNFSDSVKVKLRRMRYDTSTFISSVMQGYNISSGWRIILELVPTLFIHSRNRNMTKNENLISDESYKKAMLDLQ
jgi:hypothetical protein